MNANQLLLELMRTVPALAYVLVSGMGAAFGPLLARMADQRKIDEEVELLERLLHAHGMSAESDTINSQHHALELQFHERRRLGNTVDVVGAAAADLQDGDVSAGEPDHDWISRFFGDVRDVSNPALQSLYAKVLSGEIQRPGSFSLLALDVLKNLAPDTVRLFQTLCSACVSLTVDGIVRDSRVPVPEGDAGLNGLRPYGLSINSTCSTNTG